MCEGCVCNRYVFIPQFQGPKGQYGLKGEKGLSGPQGPRVSTNHLLHV